MVNIYHPKPHQETRQGYRDSQGWLAPEVPGHGRIPLFTKPGSGMESTKYNHPAELKGISKQESFGSFQFHLASLISPGIQTGPVLG